MNRNFKHITFSFLTIFALLCTSGCKEEALQGIPQGSGSLELTFTRHAVYDVVGNLKYLSSIKLYVTRDGGEAYWLPSVALTGNEELMASEKPLVLPMGNYKIVEMKGFDPKAALIFEATPLSENLFTVEEGKNTSFTLPVDVRVFLNEGRVKEILLDICREVLGANIALYPPTWKLTNSMYIWENLDFDHDEGLTFVGLTFDKRFKKMKTLPPSLKKLGHLTGLSIIGTDLEELGDDLSQMKLDGLVLSDLPNLKTLPASFFKQKLATLAIVRTGITTIPAEIANFAPTMQMLELDNNLSLTTLPDAIGKLIKLDGLTIRNMTLTSLPDMFANLDKVSTLSLINMGLTALPASIFQMDYLRGIELDNNKITNFPDFSASKLSLIRLENNQISNVSLTQLPQSLKDLILDGNKSLTAIPTIQSNNMVNLSLNGCALTALPALSGMPKLKLLQVAENKITSLPENTFASTPEIRSVNLAHNNLTAMPANLGVKMVQKEQIEGTQREVVATLGCVDVSYNPNLVWVVPASWCCKTVQVSWDGQIYGQDAVIVKRVGSPKVSRAKCPYDGAVLPNFPHDYSHDLKETTLP